MRLLGFNFTKINIERKKAVDAKLKINSNLQIISVEKVNSNLFNSKNENLFSVKFQLDIDYSPEIATLTIEGAVIISLDSKKSKDLLKKWKENKEIPSDIQIPLYNTILQKSSIKALQLEDDMNLPPHIVFPRIKKQENN